jgi:hypothetical protein
MIESIRPVNEIFLDCYGTFYGLSGFSFATKGNLYTLPQFLRFDVWHQSIRKHAGRKKSLGAWKSEPCQIHLSNNFFVGTIPTTFGVMEEIESLDLSHNELSGPIPW